MVNASNEIPVSKISCKENSEFSMITGDTFSKMEYSKDVIQRLLSTFVKDKIYPKMKFLPRDHQVREGICKSSIYPKGKIVIPNGMKINEFVYAYHGKIPKMFTQLRRTSEANVTNRMKGMYLLSK